MRRALPAVWARRGIAAPLVVPAPRFLGGSSEQPYTRERRGVIEPRDECLPKSTTGSSGAGLALLDYVLARGCTLL
jgi:hypothetical protein